MVRVGRLVVVLAVVAVWCMVVLAPPARAETVIAVTWAVDEVDPTDGQVSFREAISQANIASTAVAVSLSASTVYQLTICGVPEEADLSGDVDLTSSQAVRIEGRGSTVQQTCSAARVLDHHGPGSLTLSDLTVTGGSDLSSNLAISAESDGVGLRSAGTLDLEGVRVTGNGDLSQGQGVAVATTGAGSFTVNASSVDHNNANGILDEGTSGSFSMAGSTVSDNIGWGPLGCCALSADALTVLNRDVTVVASSFERNIGPGMTMPPVVWPPTGGTQGAAAGAIAVLNQHWLHGSGVTVRANAGFISGGIDGAIDLTDSVLADNWSGIGGAMNGENQPFALTRVRITGNHAPLGGGGLVGYGSILDSTIADNEAGTGTAACGSCGAGGAGLLLGPTTIDRSTISGNHASAGGGFALTDWQGHSGGGLSLRHATLAGDSSVSSTGGQEVLIDSTAAVQNGSLDAAASIIGTPGAGPACVLAGRPVTSGGYNVVSDGSCLVSGTSDLANIGDPHLGALADNGGPTQTRIVPGPSPATDLIPAGTPGLCTGIDQRGVPVPQGPGCDAGAAETVKSGFHAVAPQRVLDTRDGTGAPRARVGPGGTIDLAMSGHGGVPASHVSAVALTVTAVGPSAASHVTVWPAGWPIPATSNLNLDPGRTIANSVTVATGSDGHIELRNNAGDLDLVADVSGWFDDGIGSCPCGDGLTTTEPKRLLDTRDGTGGPVGRFGPGEIRTVTVGGVGPIPTDADAVVVNLTVTGTDSPSDLRAWPSGAVPLVSNLNWAAGDTIAALAIVPVGPNGTLELRNNQGHAHVIADITGWFNNTPANARFTPMAPRRVVDTRTQQGLAGPLGPGQSASFGSGAPTGAVAAAGNLTGVYPTASTHLSLWPDGLPQPPTSNLNLDPGQVRPNLTISGVDPAARLVLFNNAGTTNALYDLMGYYG